jgi:hypothetical protein
MIINVTQKHIDEGTRNNCDTCPVALALNEATERTWIVGSDSAAYKGNFAGFGWSDDIKLPLEARRFIARVDSKRSVLPFSFELDIPQ